MGRERCRAAVAALACAFGVSVAGCATATDAVSPPVAAAPSAVVIAPPAPAEAVVPTPKGKPVLVLTGRVGVTNVGRGLQWDVAGLDRLGLLRVGVFEPWVKQNLEFQGVWLTDVLKAAHVDASARSLHFTALDDYQIDLTMDDVLAGGVFLATKHGDGSAIAIEDGGPTRIVFVGGVASGASADRWIWSLTTIDVR